MSGEEVEEARDWVPIGTSSWNGGGGGSSENRGVAGFPEGVRGKIELPSKLSAVPIDDDMEKADKISELRSNGFGASSSSSSSGGGKGRRKEDDRKSSIINRLTKEQYEDICYSFSLFDVNGDGKIDKGEITHASKILGSREDIAALLGDPDGEGVTLEEFAEIMVPTLQSTQREPMEKLIKESFDVFDEDKNGFLSAKEIHGLMLKLGEELSPHEVEVMLNLVDVDGDGQISFDEFYRYIMRDPNGVLLDSGSNSPITPPSIKGKKLKRVDYH